MTGDRLMSCSIRPSTIMALMHELPRWQSNNSIDQATDRPLRSLPLCILESNCDVDTTLLALNKPKNTHRYRVLLYFNCWWSVTSPTPNLWQVAWILPKDISLTSIFVTMFYMNKNKKQHQVLISEDNDAVVENVLVSIALHYINMINATLYIFRVTRNNFL